MENKFVIAIHGKVMLRKFINSEMAREELQEMLTTISGTFIFHGSFQVHGFTNAKEQGGGDKQQGFPGSLRRSQKSRFTKRSFHLPRDFRSLAVSGLEGDALHICKAFFGTFFSALPRDMLRSLSHKSNLVISQGRSVSLLSL